MSRSSKYCKHVRLLITDDDDKMIKKLVRELKCSTSEILRQAIRDYCKRYESGSTLLFLRNN